LATESQRDPHYPGRAAIEGYGAGGFRFAGMSHRGAILLLPAGIWAWPPRTVAEIDEGSLARLAAACGDIDFFLIGTGDEHRLLPDSSQRFLRELGIRFDVMPTAAAASTYNILLSEGRRVAAALLPTD
jgi:uncharacterized protein